MDSLRQIFATFGVTWPTFLAQLITVGIVYFILKKFAFGPIIAVLEERRRKIADGQANAEKIRKDLAAAEIRYKQMLDDANKQAQRLIDEARLSSSALAEQRKAEALDEAERIVSRAREATQMEHDRVLVELKREVGRLVVQTTAKVAGKVLTNDDQQRLADEASRDLMVDAR